jgi:acetyl esterase/lipase
MPERVAGIGKSNGLFHRPRPPAPCHPAGGAQSRRVLLYLHGGGYVIGSINTHRDLAGRLSRAAAAHVLLIDYRLAPEHPHPAAVEDATTAYRSASVRSVG